MLMKHRHVPKTEQMSTETMSKKRSSTLIEQPVTGISHDRRSKRRYPIELPVQYKIMKNYLVMGTGSGTSLDLSSGGIAFTSNAPLKIGSYLELSISWPVLLNQSCPLKLVASGRVVRSDQNRTAISLDRYEFRTSGAKTLRSVAAQESLTMAFHS
jgi:c-di-GMP-binding flagellar brake protein YcgR